MKLTILIKIFKSLEIHCKCENHRFLSRHSWYLLKGFRNLWRSSESLFCSHLDCNCKSDDCDCLCGSLSHTMFKAFLGPSNPSFSMQETVHIKTLQEFLAQLLVFRVFLAQLLVFRLNCWFSESAHCLTPCSRLS